MGPDFQMLSVGSLVQKLLAIHPELGIDALIAIVKQSIDNPGHAMNGLSSQILNETRALELARTALNQLQTK